MSKHKTKSQRASNGAPDSKPVAALNENEAPVELKRLAQVVAYHEALYYRLDAPQNQ